MQGTQDKCEVTQYIGTKYDLHKKKYILSSNARYYQFEAVGLTVTVQAFRARLRGQLWPVPPATLAPRHTSDLVGPGRTRLDSAAG